MDKKSKILIGVFVLLIVASVGVTYWRIMIKKDYVILAQADCDPYLEKCFVWECDPESTEEGEACTGDPEEDIWYYQNIRRQAFNIPLCDPNEETCEALTCPEGEADCAMEFCTPENVPEGETCNDPVEYTLANPPEEEECDPELDEECVVEEECDPETDAECVVEEDTTTGTGEAAE